LYYQIKEATKMKLTKEQMSTLIVTAGGGLYFSDGSGISCRHNYEFYPNALDENTYQVITEEEAINMVDEKEIVPSPDNLLEDKEVEALLKSWGMK
jgi:hypothetical protein